MQSKAKSNSVVTTRLDESGQLVIDVLGSGSVVFNPKKAHATCRARAELHGWTQRLVDKAAMNRDTATGKPASPADKYAAIKELAEHYMSGAEAWSVVGGGTGSRSITLLAIAEVQKVTYEEAESRVATFAKNKYAGDTKKALAFLRDGARVAQAIVGIRARTAKAPVVDADEALGELK